MSVGLMALLDDIAALAKVAAASLDDVASQAAQAGTKAAGVVIDDAAVTPRYVTGFSASRELPIIGRIALGSLRNKLLFLLPAALVLSLLAPQVILPLLMLGGLYLCYEGAEKIYGLIFPHAAHAHEAEVEPIGIDARSFEDQKVAGAIRTDFILSAEIMTITLGSVPNAGLMTQALVLAVVGVAITIAVYGAVALIVKADDVGLVLARVSSHSPIGVLSRVIGRVLVQGMPHFLKLLGILGTAAMVWVGGGIILHGFAGYGYGWLSHLLHDAGDEASHIVPSIGSFVSWLVQAAGAGLVGIAIGAAAIPAMSYCISPAWRWIKTRVRPARPA
ncbi:putative Inner membrane protein YedI [Hyphomicrobiales bacterium]|nr:putative Inner membrane protein YedI [Hyphomicrobiales bacterium]CAH1689977.1 putative Inner membrane protein YedI [Hyphomicrobiales bacterium]